ncbi:MAG: thiamine pyrophosphate-binding protein [Promethearchaeota archaeon]
MSKYEVNPIENEENLHGGDILVRALHAENVKFIFGIPGGEYLPFLEALERWGENHGMKYIGVRHEQAGAQMADAVYRVTGRVAMCCGTVGPGFLNMVSGLGSAWADNIPVLAIHPQQDNKFEDHHRLQSGLNQLAMLKPIVKYQKHVSDKNRIAWAVQKCFKELYSGRPGPVQLEIREDALSSQVDDYGRIILKPSQYRCMEPPNANPKLIEAAVELILNAEKPIIVSGGGVTSSGSWEQLRKLSSTFGIPVMTTVMGIGTMSTMHDTYIGATLGNGGCQKAARETDLILALGVKFSYAMGYGKPPIWNPDAKVIQVDIDPQMIGKNRPVDVGMIGDCGTVLVELNKALNSKKLNIADDWLSSLKAAREQDVKSLQGKLKSTKIPILPHRLIAELTGFMEPDDILCIDGGDIAVLTINYIDYVKPRNPRSVVISIGFGHLGAGIPYAIGAKLAAPDKRVFLITGDGSFMFNIQELDTAMKYNTPFVCVIADNCSWGMIKNAEKRAFGKKRGDFYVDLCTDYVQVAKGFGCYAERVDDPEKLKDAFQRAVNSNKPAIVHVPIKFASPPGAKLLASFRQLKF